MTCDCSPGLSQLQHSWCNNIQVVKGYKVTLNTSDVYLLPPVAYRDKKKNLQVKNEAAALEGDKSKTVVSNAERKKGTDQLLHYQYLRDKKLRKPQPTRSGWMLQVERNYC